MAAERDVERLFSDKIDRLAAGNESKMDQAAEERMGPELDFARKMIALGPEPSAQFKTDLKSRLLRKLAEQEAEALIKDRRNWLHALLPRQRAWQMAAAMLFVVVAGGILWGTGILRPETAPPPGTVLTVQASTNKTDYRPGEPVKIDVVLKNVTSEPFTMKQFPPILSLMQTETKQPVYTFAGGKSDRTLAPGESAEFVVNWNQVDDRGNPAPGGEYYLELEDLDSPVGSVRLNFTKPVHFDILRGTSSSGEIQKTSNWAGTTFISVPHRKIGL